MIKLKDGTLVAPRLGKAPDVPVGYKATNDLYVFKPIIPKCKKRRIIMVKDRGCNCEVPHAYCDKEPIEVFPTCWKCEVCDG